MHAWFSVIIFRVRFVVEPARGSRLCTSWFATEPGSLAGASPHRLLYPLCCFAFAVVRRQQRFRKLYGLYSLAFSGVFTHYPSVLRALPGPVGP